MANQLYIQDIHTIELPEKTYATYNLEAPELNVKLTTEELLKMYKDMVTVRYVVAQFFFFFLFTILLTCFKDVWKWPLMPSTKPRRSVVCMFNSFSNLIQSLYFQSLTIAALIARVR